MRLGFTEWRLYLLFATGQKRRFKMACKEYGLSNEQIKNIITL